MKKFGGLLVAFSRPVTLEELPEGSLFSWSDAHGNQCIAMKSKYRMPNNLIEAYILGSGELFWGDAETVEEQSRIVVQPLAMV